MNFRQPPKFGKALGMKPPAAETNSIYGANNVNQPVNINHSNDTLHALNEEIGRRRTSLYANPGETVTPETGKPSYFTGIKRLLRTRYGSGGQL